jgi:chorismate mutase-like protein
MDSFDFDPASDYLYTAHEVGNRLHGEDMAEGRDTLSDLRARIDDIDSALHDLLMQRSALVEEIADVKREEGVVMRPGREAKVIRRLLARHDGRIPVGVLVRIWREIISACTALQEELTVAIYEDEQVSSFERLARAHFGSMTALTRFSSVSGVMHAITEKRATVGLLPLDTGTPDNPWWLYLARRAEDTPRVIARLPFVLLPDRSRDDLEALVLGLVPPEVSGQDHSLLIIETREELSRAALVAALGKAGLQRAERGIWEDTPDSRRHLVEVESFVEDDDPRLSDLAPRDGEAIEQVSVAGAFAMPVDDGATADASG